MSHRYPSLSVAMPPNEVPVNAMVWGREGAPPNRITGWLKRVSPARRNGEQVGWRVILTDRGAREYAPWVVPMNARLVVTL
jgi:hypothetical protein